MAWSRIESSFWKHPKFEGWKASEKWALGELFGYCCEYRTEGIVPQDMSLLPRSVTPAFIKKCVNSGWIDVLSDGTWQIHDWHVYHPKDPTASVRQSRRRHVLRRDKTVTVTPPTNTNTNTNNPSFLPTPTTDVEGRKEIDTGNILKEVDAA